MNTTIIGASNTRGISNKLPSELNCLAYVHPGRQLHQMGSRISNMMNNDTDALVLHLGTNDGLNATSDSQCLLNADDGLDDIETTLQDKYGDVPVFLCAVPPIRQGDSQRRVEMLNALYKRRCERNQQLHFIETDLQHSDLGRDGLHLTNDGKIKLANAITKAVQDFTLNPHRAVT